MHLLSEDSIYCESYLYCNPHHLGLVLREGGIGEEQYPKRHFKFSVSIIVYTGI